MCKRKTSCSSSAPPAQWKQATTDAKTSATTGSQGPSNETISSAPQKSKKKTQMATFNSATSNAIVNAALDHLAAQASLKDNKTDT